MRTQINSLFKFIFVVTLFFSSELFSIESGAWTFTKDKNWCYIGSMPIKEEGDYTQRGDTYFLVYRMNKKPEAVVQINAGYNYAEKKDVEVIIDKNTYIFSIIEGDTAWSNEDKKIINAMKRGKDMIIRGFSHKGTLTTDTYTLIGFTTAYNKLIKDC